MRGHIRQRSPGSWTIYLDIGRDPATGRRRQKLITVHGKQLAEKKLTQLLNEIDKGTYSPPTKVTLKVFLEKWLNDYVRQSLSPRTAEGYETIIRRHLIPRLGAMPLAQLKLEHIQDYYASLVRAGRSDARGGLNATTVQHHHTLLHKALKSAVRLHLIPFNPADGAGVPPARHPPEMQTFTPEEVESFLEKAKTTGYYALFYLVLFTGLRRSEALALRWTDVDLLMCTLSVTRALHQLHDRSFIYREPKTTRSRRTIALSPSTAIILRAHKAEQEAQRKMVGKAFAEDGLIFCHLDGGPLRPDSISQAWRRLAGRAGLKKKVRLHDARHTHATLLFKEKVHPKVVQERLGHASIETTLNIYSHVLPGMQEAAAEKFDNAVFPSQKGTEK